MANPGTSSLGSMPADCGPSPSARSMLPEQPGAACAVGGAGGPLYPPQLGFDRRTVVIGLSERCQGVVQQRGGQEAVPIGTMIGLPLHHCGLSAPIIVERCGRWSNPALSRSQLFPLRHTPGQGFGPFATVSFAQDVIPMPQSPVEVPVRAKAAVQPKHGPAPLRWRQRGDLPAILSGRCPKTTTLDQKNNAAHAPPARRSAQQPSATTPQSQG